MAKVFIDTETLPKAFRKLEPSLKLAWYYIWTHCDRSGVWDIDDDLFEFENGLPLDINGFREAFKPLIEISGEKILLKDFIKVNYGTLNYENYNPHKPVLREMAKNNIKLDPSLNQACFKLVDEDEDKEEEEDKEKGGMGEKTKPSKIPKAKPEFIKPEVNLIFETEAFSEQWRLWKIYKQEQFGFKYKNAVGEQAQINKLHQLAAGDEKTAIAIIHESMAQGWKGFFELKNKANGQQSTAKPGSGRYTVSDSLQQKIAERLQPR